MAETVLDAAYAGLCQQRREWPAADVWRFRQHWPEEKAPLRADLLAGTYEVGLLSRVPRQHGAVISRDGVLSTWTSL